MRRWSNERKLQNSQGQQEQQEQQDSAAQNEPLQGQRQVEEHNPMLTFISPFTLPELLKLPSDGLSKLSLSQLRQIQLDPKLMAQRRFSPGDKTVLVKQVKDWLKQMAFEEREAKRQEKAMAARDQQSAVPSQE